MLVIRLWANKPDDGNPVDAVGKIRIEVDGKDPLEIGADNGKVGAENIFDGGAKKIIAVAVSQIATSITYTSPNLL